MAEAISNFTADIVDRYAEEPGKVALRWSKPGGAATEMTFLDLKIRSEKVARVLHSHGVRPDHRVFILLPPCVAWWESVLGCMRTGAVAVLGQDASEAAVLKDQIFQSRASLVIAPDTLVDLIDSFRVDCTRVAHWFSVGWDREGWVDYDRRVSLAPAGYNAVRTRGTDPCIVVFDQATSTRGTTYRHGDASYGLAQLDAWREGAAVALEYTSGHP